MKPDGYIPDIQTGKYEHYKGGLYEVLGVARHSENREWFVVYKPLYDHDGQADIWIRPYEMFIEEVTLDGTKQLRFKKIE